MFFFFFFSFDAEPQSSIGSIQVLRTGDCWFDLLARPVFFLTVDYSYCQGRSLPKLKFTQKLMPYASAEARSTDRGRVRRGGICGRGVSPLLPGGSGVGGVFPMKFFKYKRSFVAPGGYLTHILL